MINNFNNKNVVITRPVERSKVLANLVKECGGTPIIIPTLELQLVESKELLNIVNNISEFDWIIFTSPAGVKSFFNVYDSDKIPCKIAVIGIKTEEELSKYGNSPDLVPNDFTAEGLLDSFKKFDLKDKNIALPRTLSARMVLPNGLEEYGANVVIAEAYTSAIPKDTSLIIKLGNDIIKGDIDIITFTSPLTVTNFIDVFRMEEPDKINQLITALQNDVVIASIGPITNKALSKYDIEAISPKKYTVKDMVEELLEKIN